VRGLASLAAQAGFVELEMVSHGYVETGAVSCASAFAGFGASALAAEGLLSLDTAAALVAESRRRVAACTFFSHIAYASLLAVRP
jgi:hypothetical protein